MLHCCHQVKPVSFLITGTKADIFHMLSAVISESSSTKLLKDRSPLCLNMAAHFWLSNVNLGELQTGLL